MSHNVALYARISKDRAGAGLGVDRQLADCRERAAQLGWTVTVERVDNDLSAYSGKTRPGYNALLNDLRTGQVSAVIAWHPDRLHRRPAELEEFISLCESRGVAVQTCRAGEVDLSTPSGRMVARMLGAAARHEVEHMVERQQSAKLRAARDGKFRGGRRAFGYNVDGLTVCEPEALVIRELASRAIAGESMKSLARDLNERGLTGTRGALWTGASIRDALVRPRNAGLMVHHGEIMGPALWPAVLPQDTWRALRAVLTDPHRIRVKSMARRWLGSGLYLCGRSGCDLTARITSTGAASKGTARWSYRCRGDAVHVDRSAIHVDALVTATVLSRLSQPDAADLFGPDSEPGEDAAALYVESAVTQARLDELVGLFAEKAIDARQLADGSRRFREQLADLEKRINAAFIPTVLDGLVDVPDVDAVWEGLSLDRQRAVVDSLVSVTILPGKRGRKPGGIYFDPETVDIQWRDQT